MPRRRTALPVGKERKASRVCKSRMPLCSRAMMKARVTFSPVMPCDVMKSLYIGSHSSLPKDRESSSQPSSLYMGVMVWWGGEGREG